VVGRLFPADGEARIITPEEFRAGVIVQPEPWIAQYLVDHPEILRDLEPWPFQVAMAALVERRGLRITMGPKGADDGVDFRAERDTEFGHELILVQVKHPQPGNKVAMKEVKLLHVEVLVRHATRGLVMTDATFTRGALKQIAAYPFQMGGIDGERLKKWLEAFRNGDPAAGLL
jgi:restriction endonuclease Mrr